ncbi:MAG: PspC domain-containing protein [Sphingomicrobium sp.]
MSHPQSSLLFRNDTILGVCEGLGQDLGFHPNWLRIAFALAFYFSPIAVIATYFALGALVAGSRFIYPDRIISAAVPVAASDERTPPEQVQLPLAA